MNCAAGALTRLRVWQSTETCDGNPTGAAVVSAGRNRPTPGPTARGGHLRSLFLGNKDVEQGVHGCCHVDLRLEHPL